MKVALLRGVNVGGRNRLRMKDMRTLLEQVGATDARTYLQSGNAVFSAPDDDEAAFADRLSAAIEAAHGFRPLVLVLDGSELARAVERNPFPEADAAPKAVHLFFPVRPASSPDLQALEAVRRDGEAFALLQGVLYLHAPEGIGRSKLAERIDRALGAETTARNWRTVTRLLAMLRDGAGPA